jgi:hypothetical protein
MSDASTCLTCGIYRPDTTARIPNHPPICDGDRQLLDRHLTEIAHLVGDLSNPEPPIVDQRRYERHGIRYLKDGVREIVSLGEVWADPAAPFDGVAAINSRSKQPSVSGSRERPIPIGVTALDLKAGAKVPNPTRAVRDWPEDQVGHLSAATILDQWIRDIRIALFPSLHLPDATVSELVRWLQNRLEDICDHYPAVVGFAEEIRNLRSALRSAAGESDPQPELCEGIACRRCDLMTLYRQPGGDVSCANPDCAAVLREDEYLEWVKTLAAEVKIKRHAEVASPVVGAFFISGGDHAARLRGAHRPRHRRLRCQGQTLRDRHVGVPRLGRPGDR